MTTIRAATVNDLNYILDLSKKENFSIGFIPKPAYESAITGIKNGKRWSKTCNDGLWVCEENKELVGFVLSSFGVSPKIAQICIQNDARLVERGKALLDAVVLHGENIGKFNFYCGCADDLESNIFWKRVGFKKIGTRKGVHFESKKNSERNVNIYHFESQNNPQLPIFCNNDEKEGDIFP